MSVYKISYKRNKKNIRSGDNRSFLVILMQWKTYLPWVPNKQKSSKNTIYPRYCWKQFTGTINRLDLKCVVFSIDRTHMKCCTIITGYMIMPDYFCDVLNFKFYSYLLALEHTSSSQIIACAQILTYKTMRQLYCFHTQSITLVRDSPVLSNFLTNPNSSYFFSNRQRNIYHSLNCLTFQMRESLILTNFDWL